MMNQTDFVRFNSGWLYVEIIGSVRYDDWSNPKIFLIFGSQPKPHSYHPVSFGNIFFAKIKVEGLKESLPYFVVFKMTGSIFMRIEKHIGLLEFKRHRESINIVGNDQVEVFAF